MAALLSAVDFMLVVFLCLGGIAPPEGVLHRRAEREGYHQRDHDRYKGENRPRPVMTCIYQASLKGKEMWGHKI